MNDEPKNLVTILGGLTIEERTLDFDGTMATVVSDWLKRNDIPHTRMSRRTYDMLIKARKERQRFSK